MIEYPDAPTVGDIVTAENGAAWQWDGTAWVYVVAPPEGTVVQVGPAVGTISAWATSAPVPPDALVCDGQPVPGGSAYDALRSLVGANVPDLRDRFLVGASSTRPPATVGGEATHILTPGEMPSHTHVQDGHAHPFIYGGAPTAMPYTPVPDGAGGVRFSVGTLAYGDISIGATTPTNQYTGGNAAHNNLPPFYAVVFIIQARATTAVLPSVAGSGGGDGRSGFTFVTDEMPAPTTVGETWFNSSTSAGGGSSYVAVDEGGGSLVWVQFAPGSGAPPVPVALAQGMFVAQTPVVIDTTKIPFSGGAGSLVRGGVTVNNAAGTMAVASAGVYRATTHFAINLPTASIRANWVYGWIMHYTAANALVASIEILQAGGLDYATLTGNRLFDMAAGDYVITMTANATGNPVVVRGGVMTLERVG